MDKRRSRMARNAVFIAWRQAQKDRKNALKNEKQKQKRQQKAEKKAAKKAIVAEKKELAALKKSGTPFPLFRRLTIKCKLHAAMSLHI